MSRSSHFWGNLFSDSRIKKDVINKQIEIFDSTTISLFQDILKSKNCVKWSITACLTSLIDFL